MADATRARRDPAGSRHRHPANLSERNGAIEKVDATSLVVKEHDGRLIRLVCADSLGVNEM
jgi:hypothetical protein